MTARSPETRQHAAVRAFLIAVVLFVSFAYFYQGGGWNQNSRFDLVRSLIEQGTLRIDSYHENTGDKALYQGHYYSDKAPGLALLALPAVAAMRPVLATTGVSPGSPRGLVALSYIATVFGVSLPTAAACACLFLLALRLGSSVSASAFGAIATGLATPVWAWATLLWGHALAGACLVLALAAAAMLQQTQDPVRDRFWGFVVGLTAGWATVSEYPAAPASAIVAILTLTVVWPSGRQRRWRVAGSVAAGAVICVMVLLVYHRAAFGSSLHLGYSYYQAGAFPWMTHGFMGLTYPKPDVMLKLLFGCRRGLLFYGPVLAAAPFGLRLLWKNPSTAPIARASAAIATYYFLFNASFSAWHGAWSYGPRYMGAGVPLLAIGIAPVWSRAGSYLRAVLALLAVCGLGLSLMGVSTTAQPPNEFRCPALQLFWPSFSQGRFSLNQGSFLAPTEEVPEETHGAFNLGELVGLHGLPSLIPLFVFWSIALSFWLSIGRNREAAC